MVSGRSPGWKRSCRLRRFRNSVAAGGIALALIIIGKAAIGQEAPESILPPGFSEPTPAPTARATQGVTPAPSAAPIEQATPRSSSLAGVGEEGTVSDAEIKAPILSPTELAKYELPAYARRSTRVVGVAGPAEGGFNADIFGRADGKFLEALMARVKAPIASRWVSIGLRQALATKVATPPRVNASDFAAERAWLLLRMGEANVSRALVESIDSLDYTPKMFEAAMQAALATGDPALVCPVVAPAQQASRDRAWVLAQAMCNSLSGHGTEADVAIKAARRSGTARGIDLLLAERVVGIGSKGQSITIEWDNVDQLTIWRYGLAIATGVEIPSALYGTVSPRVQYWRAQAATLSPRARAEAAELAAAQGVLSNAALVDLYGQIDSEEDQAAAEVGIARDLRSGYTIADRDQRVAALRTLWDEPKQPQGQYARLILTARAAATIIPDRGVPETDRLIAAMLSAGLESRALRWQDYVARGSDGWAMLALVDTGISVSRGDFDAYRSRASDLSGVKAKMLLAGFAGLGRLSERDATRLASAVGVNLELANSWTRAIHRAAIRRQPGTVLLLAAIGMQTTNWQGVSPEALYHIVAALQQVGLEGQARMLAVEALTRL